MVDFDSKAQDKTLSDLHLAEEERFVEEQAAKRSLPFISGTTVSVDFDALRILPEDSARAAEIAPFDIVNKTLKVATFSPEKPATQEMLESIQSQGYTPEIYMASHATLEKIWKRYEDLSFAAKSEGGALSLSEEEIQKTLKETRSLADVQEQLKTALTKKSDTSKILELVISGALAIKASDVHFEPEEESARLRYRLDGVLTDIAIIDNHTYKLILSRIELLSGLKLNVKGEAQDGRFSIHVGENDIEIRTSIIPGAYSESVVLRVLNPDAISVGLDQIGIHPRLLEVLKKEIKKPNGMILNTGPTGSGKTTTLYAFLKSINTPDVKIITIENPIEYHLPGIVQTQTDREKKYTFAAGLRSALRQDPDVMMVGEIRDEETAEIAINAALTGHLVFSTLHTNNAAGTFPRLIDLGVNPKVISSALSVAMAQRLVRTLCTSCKKEHPLEGEAKKRIESILSTIADVSYLEGISTDTVWAAESCSECNNTGYKGRVGVFEAILTDEAIEQVVQNNPSEREIRKAAAPQNILTMEQDGVVKVLKGITTLEEIERVIEITPNSVQ